MTEKDEGVLPEKEEVKPRKKKKVTPTSTDRLIAAREEKRKKEPIEIRSRWPRKILVKEDSMPSGRRYVFPKGGSVVAVAPQDVDVLLSRRRSVGCCGAGRVEEPFFELV
jgi:hypothetical protein